MADRIEILRGFVQTARQFQDDLADILPANSTESMIFRHARTEETLKRCLNQVRYLLAEIVIGHAEESGKEIEDRLRKRTVVRGSK